MTLPPLLISSPTRHAWLLSGGSHAIATASAFVLIFYQNYHYNLWHARWTQRGRWSAEGCEEPAHGCRRAGDESGGREVETGGARRVRGGWRCILADSLQGPASADLVANGRSGEGGPLRAADAGCDGGAAASASAPGCVGAERGRARAAFGSDAKGDGQAHGSCSDQWGSYP